jgi:hypothetical protein
VAQFTEDSIQETNNEIELPEPMKNTTEHKNCKEVRGKLSEKTMTDSEHRAKHK